MEKLSTERVKAIGARIQEVEWPHLVWAMNAISELLGHVDALDAEKARAWDEGASAAWSRSTPEVNGQNCQWRHEGQPLNPYQEES